MSDKIDIAIHRLNEIKKENEKLDPNNPDDVKKWHDNNAEIIKIVEELKELKIQH